MVGCPSDAVWVTNYKSNPFLLPMNSSSSSSRRRRRFNSREALFLIQRCNSFKQLKQIHSHILRNGLLYPHSHHHDRPLLNEFLLTQLLLRLFPSFSSSSSHHFNKIDYATTLLLFHHSHSQTLNPLLSKSAPTPTPTTTFNWNLMIRFHTLNGTSHQALLLYNLMIHLSIPPDNFTFPFVIRACLLSSAFHLGKAIHATSIKTGFSIDIFVQNTLMDMYFKSGDSFYGRKVFDKMLNKTVVSWTTMLVGLVSCGKLEDARAVFDLMPIRNVVSWTAMIAAYARNKQPQEAFQLFQRMQQLHHVRPNEFTLVSLLVASTELRSLELGSLIHDFARRRRLGLGVFFGTALIDMYSKCGSLEDAMDVFHRMPQRSLATWNSMITSLGVHGRGNEALSLFREMEKANVQPDAISFVGVLRACLQEGLVDEGCRFFRYMRERYRITPIVDHYVCMITLLGHAGMLDEAYQLANIMPAKPNGDVWEALRRASRAYGNTDLEEVVSKHIEEIESTRDTKNTVSMI